MKTVKIEIHVPDWVEWVAQDRDGCITFYEQKPHAVKDEGIWVSMGGDFYSVDAEEKPIPNWLETLRRV